MSIAAEITRLRSAKAALKAEINRKGGNITDETLEWYSLQLAQLPTYSTETEFYRCYSVDGATKTWSGYKAVFSEGVWSFHTMPTHLLHYAGGYVPRVGEIYSANATVWVRLLFTSTTEKMLLLCHFEDGPADSTETCRVAVMPQAEIRTTLAKFGTHSYWFNYFMPSYPNGGLYIKRLPPLNAFTLDFWQHNTTGYTPMGGTIIQMPAAGSSAEATMGSTVIPTDDPGYITGEWFHHAFVREAGSATVTEYINGAVVGTVPFAETLGGREIRFYAGGAEGSNAGKHVDELAIFNYAKYSGAFTPPTAPYEDVISDYWPPPTPREVTVAGCVSAPYANDPSYALMNATATGTNRVWATGDGSYFIKFDQMRMQWVISDRADMYEGNIFATGPGPDGEPIGGAWMDNNGSAVVTVTAN